MLVGGTTASSDEMFSGFVLFSNDNEYQTVSLVTEVNNATIGDRVSFVWIANSSTYVQIFSDSIVYEVIESNIVGYIEFKLDRDFVDISVGLNEPPEIGDSVLLQYSYNLDGDATLESGLEYIPPKTEINVQSSPSQEISQNDEISFPNIFCMASIPVIIRLKRQVL